MYAYLELSLEAGEVAPLLKAFVVQSLSSSGHSPTVLPTGTIFSFILQGAAVYKLLLHSLHQALQLDCVPSPESDE